MPAVGWSAPEGWSSPCLAGSWRGSARQLWSSCEAPLSGPEARLSGLDSALGLLGRKPGEGLAWSHGEERGQNGDEGR
jgi:hypothetical protein